MKAKWGTSGTQTAGETLETEPMLWLLTAAG